jgi:transaldolase
MVATALGVKLFHDCAELESMIAAKGKLVSGFTTNPTLI